MHHSLWGIDAAADGVRFLYARHCDHYALEALRVLLKKHAWHLDVKSGLTGQTWSV